MRQERPQPVRGGYYVDAKKAVLMKVRSHTTLVGVFPVITHVRKSEPGPLGLRMAEFAGRFTLPFDAAWGEMLLPQGDYALYYGALGKDLH